MRILIKGGVWKNTEDEILKAAVMKYGKNQWSRISSLLVRKSAKQCKARWHEWLDPSIKKTEWSREEEEKLLHLAKLMPTQWRTIAPIVGRTAAQCLEHYERLLDQATRKDKSEDLSAADDPRRLRPGEIDPNPESKPARPDPIDMDEDEKEMLSEARARLANTRGKKAKRKAREKQLEESRRLAALQKRRELKAAGIELSARSRKVRGVDYNTEIPFQKMPPKGFFDTMGEDAAAEAAAGHEDGDFRSKLKSKLDAPNRDKAEEKARKADAEKVKRKREDNLPAAIDQINKLNDPAAVRKRGRLMLPPPQVTDRELEGVVKASASAIFDDDGAGATRALMSSYEQTPSAQTMRTPRSATAADTVLEEAAVQAALLAGNTPLLGGENTLPVSALGDFGGITPRAAPQATPNPVALATPGATPGRVGDTPGRSGSTPVSSRGGFTPSNAEGMTPTPSRDALGINESDGSEITGLSAALAKRMQKRKRDALAAQLGSLPAPNNDYKIVMPELPEEEEEEEDTREEDALDTEAREAEEAAAAHASEMAKRSMALQRELPRPMVVNHEMLAPSVGSGALAAADQELRKEMVRMLEADASAFPVPGAPEPKKRKPLRVLPEDLMTKARDMLALETEAVRSSSTKPTPAQLQAAMEAAEAEVAYVPALQKYARLSTVGQAERLQAPQQQLQLVKNFMARDAKRANKAEKKVDVLLGGYKKRAAALSKEIQAKHEAIASKRVELACFQALEAREAFAAPQRLAELRQLLKEQTDREGTLQAKYAEALRLRNSLYEQLRARAEAAA
mmetsp:Transcript_38779/g.82618  ORF Transcript_38779/g.82618 Transcript_38779/m.82618 type:complete len:798 (-) Transcript_38779:366-2759(-)|eukprot:CAMPEP_0183344602 /NCGR_PEP_ID=MMETSP0164_2-20130417/10237_1 /TAXON_ID=221442 /ORGANISM="Coccolithus pelagicus ssp braarudi, Strain PLY182g" /LENGTH=797 /DNA_ID=CAMNT_0025515619 /DNA_START=22 /DNA_END=2415 /DNA_ORIENTATION=-